MSQHSTLDAPTAIAGRQPDALVRDVLLRDGSTLRLRAPRPADFDRIRAFYDGLSWRSRFFRFCGYPRLDLAAREDVEAGGVDRIALIGLHSGRVVASARFDALRERGVAEVSFAVADDFQRRGVGTRMLEQLATIAQRRGIHRFDAYVMAENSPMLAVFEHAGYAVRRVGSAGEVTVSLDLTPSEFVQERVGERDHVGAVAALRSVLAPSSIAVLGSPTRPGSLEGLVVANICAGGFRGDVFAVDRAGGRVGAIRAARNLSELPVTPELVIVAAGGGRLLRQAAEAAACGAHALLALPGEREENREMPPEQRERLLEILRDSGLRMVGPGSLGVINLDPGVRLNATFSRVRLRPGALAIACQAPALGLGLLEIASARQLGVSTFVSLGGRADVSTSDVLEWCAEDAHTSAVMLHVETFGDPRRFMRVAEHVALKKPVLVLEGSLRQTQRRDGAGSATSADVHGDQIFDAVLQHAGVLRFRSGEELFQAAELFASQPRSTRGSASSPCAGSTRSRPGDNRLEGGHDADGEGGARGRADRAQRCQGRGDVAPAAQRGEKPSSLGHDLPGRRA